jgi:DUF438 domain-containing protein
MSEMINNREYRQKVLKEIIMDLHKGKTVDEVKERFDKLIEGVSVSEISQMEQSLIMEGLPIEEVQRLCDVHAAVFKGSIEDIHKPNDAQDMPGHPIHTFRLENRAIERLIDDGIQPALERFENEDSKENAENLLQQVRKLLEIDKHYSRKENILFPLLEKYDITGPPKVMWGVDDEIRADIKDSILKLANYDGSLKDVTESINSVLHSIREMIFKEENILFPMAVETLTEDEWLKAEQDSDEIGYCLVRPAGKWKPARKDVKTEKAEKPDIDKGSIRLETGVFTGKELEAMLNSLPVDITFVDKDDIVKYFSQGKERIFARTKSVIGRNVSNCHPPASVHIVEKIVEDFKSGKKDHEDFWIQRGDMFILIRYFAVRSPEGEYLGTVEFSQNIQPLRELTGEKRLLEE